MGFERSSLKLEFNQHEETSEFKAKAVLKADYDGRTVVIATTDEKGGLQMNNDLYQELHAKGDNEGKQFILNAWKSAQETIKKDEEQQLNLKNKGVNAFLNSYRVSEVKYKEFKDKVEDTEQNPFGRLAVCVAECAKYVGGYIAHNKVFDKLGEGFQKVKNLASDLKYIAYTMNDEKSKDMMSQLIPQKIKDNVQGFISKWKDMTAEIKSHIIESGKAKGEINTALLSWDSKIDAEALNQNLSKLADQTREETGLDEVISIANDVEKNVGGMDYETYKECERVVETVGERPELHIISQPNYEPQTLYGGENSILYRKDQMKYMEKVFPEQLKQIVGNIYATDYVAQEAKEGGISFETPYVMAVRCSEYSEPCFKATVFNKEGTKFDMVFNPDMEMIQLSKKGITQEVGEVVFNNTAKAQYIDHSVVNNGQTKAFLDKMPVAQQSIDNFNHDKSKGYAQPTQQRTAPVQG